MLLLISVPFLRNFRLLSLFRWSIVKVFLELVYFFTIMFTWTVIRFIYADFKERAEMKSFTEIGLITK